VERHRPATIFLTAALTHVDYCEDHPEEAFTGLVRDGQNPRFADFFYYSVMTAFISPPNDIIAASRGARSATLIEMLTGLSLLATYLTSLVVLPGSRSPGPCTDRTGPDAG
jgi:hypothetical protein